ncbi:hypothetical protein B4U79_03903, partial [Dinothrombium tinctorium]
MVEIRPGNNG